MFKPIDCKYNSKQEFYENLLLNAKGLMYEEKDYIANLSNISALLFHTMEKINWVGFYLYKDNQLVLGPFQGKPACIRIEMGKGVCGTGAKSREIQVVSNVHEFQGHIACDGDTNSEIVLPMIVNSRLLGVLDVDSPVLERFDLVDSQYLTELVSMIVNQCKWDK